MQTRVSETFNTVQDNRLNANSGIRRAVEVRAWG